MTPKPFSRSLVRQRDRMRWSRREQARRFLVRRRELGILVGTDDVDSVSRTLCNWEDGEVPDATSQEVLADLLGVTIPDLFGPYAARLTTWGRSLGKSGGSLELPHYAQAEDDPMERRKFGIWLARLSAGTAVLPRAVNDLLVFGDDPELLPAITMEDVDGLAAANHLFTTWEHSVGGGASRKAVLGHLSWATDQLRAGVPGTVECRDAWKMTTTRLADTAAGLCSDSGREQQARALWALSYQVASTVERETVTANAQRAATLGWMSRQAAQLGRPLSGLDIVRQAQALADDATPLTRSMLHAMKARLYGVLGDQRMVERELGRAAEEFADRTEDDLIREPWMWSHHKGARVHYNLGTARLFVAQSAPDDGAAKPTGIAEEFLAGAEGWGDRDERARTSAQLRAATALMLGKEPERAIEVARAALPALPSLRSKRIRDDLNNLRTAAGQYIKRAEVKDLFADLGVAA